MRKGERFFMTYEETKQTADQYLMPTYAHFNAALVEGKGAQLFGPEGESYLDFTAGIGVSSLGYGDAAWAQAIAEQAAKLAHTSNLYYAGGEAVMRKIWFCACVFCKFRSGGE